ncbi:MAG: divergent polysaccharide deacetylase family protein [Hyphomonas sp.]|uniref:divergent polysaccharide deacetylase family protein n=1 Tax=Hyphomonas sp. TaxID=87 RepID=UPI0035297D96
MSFLVFGGLAAALGAGIQVAGDPSDAGPRQVLALFETHDETDPQLKARLKTELAASTAVPVELPEYDAYGSSGDMPDLGVEAPPAEVQVAAADLPAGEGDAEAAEAGGVRINGKLVRPGESYGDIVRVISLDKAPVAGMTEKVNGLTLPRVAPDGRSPADVYARPFSNPANKPVAALVIGGLGINTTHTWSAIRELPPEVTLSFAPDANKLQTWINEARAAGHEVLIEAPMEAYDYGRMKMHPQTLLADGAEADNIKRLDTLLSRASGYFGLVNYQGAKFGDNEDAMRPVLDAISQRGLALVDDGSLDTKRMDRLSATTRLRYARADVTLDARLSAEEISSSLMELETTALEKGAALGAGYAFPITIEMAKAWAAGLEQKGILLAPVSALSAVTPQGAIEGGGVMRTGSLAPAPVNPEG